MIRVDVGDSYAAIWETPEKFCAEVRLWGGVVKTTPVDLGLVVELSGGKTEGDYLGYMARYLEQVAGSALALAEKLRERGEEKP